MKKNHSIRKNLMAFALLGAGNLLCADAPLFINYQGKITTPEGNPIETSVQIGFKFYNGSGIRLNSTDVSLPVTPIKGVFSVLVPVQTPWFSNEEVLVGITVDGGEELSPRQRLVSAPYALAVADGVIKGGLLGPILDQTITNDDIDVNAGISKSKLNLTGTITDSDIGLTAGISHSKINFGSGLTSANLANGAITETKIADDAVTTTKITNLAVTNEKIADGAVTKDKINATHIQPVYITNDNRLVLGGSDQYDTSVCGVDFANTKVLFFDCNGLCDQDVAKRCSATQVGYFFRP
jgi:hypothetical protein